MRTLTATLLVAAATTVAIGDDRGASRSRGAPDAVRRGGADVAPDDGENPRGGRRRGEVEPPAVAVPFDPDAPPGCTRMIDHAGITAYLADYDPRRNTASLFMRVPEPRHFRQPSPEYLKLLSNVVPAVAFLRPGVAALRIVGWHDGAARHTAIMVKDGEKWSLRPLLRADEIAMHPDDPLKPTYVSGVDDGTLATQDLVAIVAACAQAIEVYPEEPRFQFALGRALAVHGHVEEALEPLASAAEKEYPAALAYLGKLEEDAEAAGELFEAAAGGGFGPAAAWHAQLRCTHRPPEVERLEFAGAFKQARLVEALHQGDLAHLRRTHDRKQLVEYVKNMAIVFLDNGAPFASDDVRHLLVDEVLREHLGESGNPQEQGAHMLMRMFVNVAAASQNPNAFIQNAVAAEAWADGAQNDAFVLMSEYDEATGKKVWDGMRAFLKDSRGKSEEFAVLHSADLGPMRWGDAAFVSSYGPNAEQDRAKVQALIDAGQRMTRCTYGPLDAARGTGFQPYTFFEGAVPAVVRNDPTHPMREIRAAAAAPCCTRAAERRLAGMPDQ